MAGTLPISRPSECRCAASHRPWRAHHLTALLWDLTTRELNASSCMNRLIGAVMEIAIDRALHWARGWCDMRDVRHIGGIGTLLTHAASKPQSARC